MHKSIILKQKMESWKLRCQFDAKKREEIGDFRRNLNWHLFGDFGNAGKEPEKAIEENIAKKIAAFFTIRWRALQE